MFRNLLAAFEPPVGEKADAQTMLASLLIRVAKVDGDYQEVERQFIDRLLSKKFQIDLLKAEKIRKDGEKFEASVTDTVQITREIKTAIPYEKRQLLAEELWMIILSDSKRTNEENNFMRLCAKLIGINDVDNANARKKAIKETQKNL